MEFSGNSRLLARFGRSAALAILATLAWSATAQASVYQVTNTADDAVVTPANSLRAAIENANSDPGPDTIDIATTGTVNLQGALPDLTENVDIQGPGASQFTVRRNTGGLYRIFTVQGISAAISGMTIENGKVDDHGGGIVNLGDLRLTDVTVTGNTATGDPPPSDPQISGGGILNFATGSLTVDLSTISGNTAVKTPNPGSDNGDAALGGGIDNLGGDLTIDRSTISGNTATATSSDNSTEVNATGGGISNDNGGPFIIDQSTVSGNHAFAESDGGGGAARVDGGGIFDSANSTVERTTLSGNTAHAVAGSPTERGGGIFALDHTTLLSSTLSGNAAGHGSNLAVAPFASASFGNTIFADPMGDTDCDATSPTDLNSQGYNLADDDTCNLIGTGDQPITNPSLGPLADNGGPTQTQAIPFGSPALDKGKAQNLSPVETQDQRGSPRPVDFLTVPNASGGDGTDIGALEFARPAETRITSGPSARRRNRNVRFRFASDQAASSFRCRLDGKPYAPCASPKTYRVGFGKHAFRVQARGPSGGFDRTAAVRKFRIVR